MRLTALALLSTTGQVERSSETFRRRHGSSAEFLQQSPELGRVLAGETDRVVFSVDGSEAAIEAVTDAHGTRRALLTLGADASSPPPQAGNALIEEPIDDSPAIVWLKDLDGRYLRVNRRFTTHLGISEDRFHGRTDAELAARETIDGPRLQDRDQATDEPLQLEYIVSPFEGRVALSVLRFPVRDRGGAPVAVCSVAAPLEATQVAHSEAARLMEVERFSRLDAGAVRAEFLRDWELVANGGGWEPSSPPPSESAAVPAPDYSDEIDDALADVTAERDSALAARAELGRELAHAQLRLAELDGVQAQAEAAHARLQALEREVDEARDRRGDTERAQGDLEQARADLEWARAEAERARTEADQARTEVERARTEADQARTEVERARTEAERARTEIEHARTEAERARTEAEQARTEAETLRSQAEQSSAAHEQAQLDSQQPDPGQPDSDQPDPRHPDSEQPNTVPGEQHAAPAAELEPTMRHILDNPPGPVLDEDDESFGSAVRWLPTAQRKLSASLGRMSVWRSVLKETTMIIGSEGGWDAVAAWVPDEHGGLTCAAMWTAHAGLSAFESETWNEPEAGAGSLPAQALHAPHLTWVTEIDAVDDDRLGRAAAHGLRSALLLPIRDGAATVALLELLAHASVKPDAQIAMSLEAAALQLGQFGHMLRVAG